MPHSLFVSDLHLCPTRPAIAAVFFDFLRVAAAQADALYILGDLFEFWAGDDDGTPFNRSVVEALAEASRRGVVLFLMHGNRDFLIADRFAAATGSTLLPDPAVVTLYGTPTLLLHGDTLCTDDVNYMAFRTKVRDPGYQRQFLAKSLAERKQIIAGLRAENAGEKQLKSEAIMDVAMPTVECVFRQNGCTRMIHGHTHRPALHHHVIDGRLHERWVLADWYDRGSYLRCDADGCRSMAL
jgi:UDP-2,3-diacylglucosamine hydrolase